MLTVWDGKSAFGAVLRYCVMMSFYVSRTECDGISFNPNLVICCSRQLFVRYENDECCGGIPYNRKGGLGCCDSVQYSKRSYICCKGGLHQRLAYDACCDSIPYRLAGGLGCCNSVQYSRLSYICCEGVLHGRSSSYDSCCGEIPYNSRLMDCVERQIFNDQESEPKNSRIWF